MPQMAPMLWLNLLILFTAILATAVIKMHFSSQQMETSSTSKPRLPSSKYKIWLW